MKIYLVTGPGFHVGPGTTVLLLAEHVADRQHALTDVRVTAGCALACTLQVQQFVAGSRLGLEAPPTGQMGSVDLIEKAFDDSEAERLLAGAEAFAHLLVKERKAARDAGKAAQRMRDQQQAEEAAAADRRRWTEEWNAVELLRRRYEGNLNDFLADKARERARMAREESERADKRRRETTASNEAAAAKAVEDGWRRDYEANAELKAKFPSVEEYILDRRKPAPAPAA